MRSLSMRATIFFILPFLKAVSSSSDYQVIAFFKNAPAGADTAALSATQGLFNLASQYFLNCQFLNPGSNFVLRRDLEASESTGASERSSASLRGSHHDPRHLQVTSCPSSCSSSGSTKCKSLGCAFCGRCQRQRDLPTAIGIATASGSSYSNGTTVSTSSTYTGLGNTAALAVESLFNAQLSTYCLGTFNCAIWAKIYKVLSNGTSYPLTG